MGRKEGEREQIGREVRVGGFWKNWVGEGKSKGQVGDSCMLEPAGTANLEPIVPSMIKI